ncbi:MAG: hypothetical protein QOD86_2870, partial [Miltoncostaeaceae bacterium]|nr:hypothetical protein [Miltoncostaeaceae bacterium]
ITGAARGFTDQAVALIGLGAGAMAGSRLAPHLLEDGDASPWLPLVALGGAIAGALLVHAILARLAAPLARAVSRGPGRAVDAAGGAVLGVALAVVLAWLVAAAATFQPGEGVRDRVQESAVLRALVEAVPPERVLGALYRLDPWPLLPGLPLPAPSADPGLVDEPAVKGTGASVVLVTGDACGVPIAGSGWVARDGLVVTNVHVIAGQDAPTVRAPGERAREGHPVYVDAVQDVALLDVPGLDAPSLPLGPALPPRAVVIWGHPGGGPLRALAGAVGAPATASAPGAYGGPRVRRAVVPLRGDIRPGASGGPAVDDRGRVAAMVFGSRPGGGGGAGVPVDVIARALAAPASAPVDPGPCPA